MSFGFEITKAFFDKAKVLDKIGAQEAKRLSRFGAFVRRAARGLIRAGKKPSKPGSPPKRHTAEEPNLRTIFFAYDHATHSVIIGPVAFNQKDESTDTGAMTVPEVLEKGGRVHLKEQRVGKYWQRFRTGAARRQRRRGEQGPTRIRTVQIAPRPFMAPALEKEADKFPELFARHF